MTLEELKQLNAKNPQRFGHTMAKIGIFSPAKRSYLLDRLAAIAPDTLKQFAQVENQRGRPLSDAITHMLPDTAISELNAPQLQPENPRVLLMRMILVMSGNNKALRETLIRELQPGALSLAQSKQLIMQVRQQTSGKIDAQSLQNFASSPTQLQQLMASGNAMLNSNLKRLEAQNGSGASLNHDEIEFDDAIADANKQVELARRRMQNAHHRF